MSKAEADVDVCELHHQLQHTLASHHKTAKRVIEDLEPGAKGPVTQNLNIETNTDETRGSVSGCCCRQPSCSAFLRLKSLRAQVLDLETKVDLAGRYGQTLLQRHESVVASFAEERRALKMQIEQLSLANADLESRNRATLLENRQLVEHLEGLNGSITDRDGRITDLMADLRRTEEELGRVGRMAGRSIPELERQLERLEQDLAEAQNREERVGEEGKVAVLRWQQAERTIGFLQEQLESIEREAKEERDRHADVLERVQRRRTVETELAKNKPWKRTSQNEPHNEGNVGSPSGNGIVSHFVTDLLQDNANLQLAMVELREMLHQSNEEVEILRGRLLQAPLLSDNIDATQAVQPAQVQNLSSELSGNMPQEIHVHHHYHPPSRRSADTHQSRSSSSRRKGKRRESGVSHTPRSSISGIKSPTSAILSQTSASIPQPRTLTAGSSKRWSTHSSQTGFTSASSMPSSPYESVFDRAYGDGATDISRPSSPDSLSLSPTTTASAGAFAVYEARERDSLASIVVSPPPEPSDFGSDGPSTPVKNSIAGKGHAREPSYADPTHSIILEENEDLDSSIHLTETKSTPKTESFPIPIPMSSSRPNTAKQADIASTTVLPDPIRPNLRRHASHESLISVGGMDIHTLQTRPSQLLLGKFINQPPTSTTTHQAARATAQSVAVISTEYAQPQYHHKGSTAEERNTRSPSASYLSGIIAGQQTAGRRSLPGNSGGRTSLGGKVGGWVFGNRWGSATTESDFVAVPNVVAAPAPTSTPRSSTSSTSSTVSMPRIDATGVLSSSPAQLRSKTAVKPIKLRMPGVNQSGPIFGFGPEKKLDPVVLVSGLDVDALRESLAEDAGIGSSRS